MSAPVSCACCDGPVSETRYRDQFSGAALVSCRRCGHVQASVLPSADAIACYYAGKYSEQRARVVDPAYAAVMQRRAEAQCRFLERAGLTLCGLKVCDIGCGYGALIQALRERGADAGGLEYDPACVAHCRGMGLAVRQISSEEEVGTLAGLDLVTLSHTLEHVRRVDTFLGRLRGRTRDVFIEVPNYSLRLREQFRDQEGHVHFFNRRSVQHLLERLGLRPLALGACGPELWLFWSDWGAPARRLVRRWGRDSFFGAYAAERPRGMWTRALARFDQGPAAGMTS
jgi:hypothetical protein